MDIKRGSVLVLLFIIALIFFTQYKGNTQPIPNTESLRVANWNMQIFGMTKANDASLMNSYVEKIKQYDIIFLQEIKDDSGVAYKTLCNMLVDYNCQISSRAGSTSSKEQYLVVYKKNIIISEFDDYNLLNYTDQFERPPIKVVFFVNFTRIINYSDSQLDSFNFTVWNIHVKPEAVDKELTNLQSLIVYDPNAIILGDLNADCSYYNPQNETIFRGWNWIIDDNQDTTVSSTNCAYDRILMGNEIYLRKLYSGIDTDVTSSQSDHYIVWVDLAKDKENKL